jgi:hypothetical protein
MQAFCIFRGLIDQVIFTSSGTSDIMADSFPAIVIPAEEEDFFRYTTKRWL